MPKGDIVLINSTVGNSGDRNGQSACSLKLIKFGSGAFEKRSDENEEENGEQKCVA